MPSLISYTPGTRAVVSCVSLVEAQLYRDPDQLVKQSTGLIAASSVQVVATWRNQLMRKLFTQFASRRSTVRLLMEPKASFFATGEGSFVVIVELKILREV